MPLDVKDLEQEIREQYQADDGNIPWIIGFSGGKDSTMLLQLVWNVIKKEMEGLRLRPIYVVCNNTLVENPKIIQYTDRVLHKIEEAAFEQSMPVLVERTIPKLENTFWVNLLGKGYPAPNNTFRWCTERLKISPTTDFIKRKISEEGEAIILLGTRKDESKSRKRSIEKNKSHIEGSRLRKHSQLANAHVFAPLTEVETEEVWEYLLQYPCPWGAKNRDLVTLYRNANGGDCPLVVDTSTPSCGNSRFGCWVCTVVKDDKSMDALIDNGEEWMEPLADFRDMLVQYRNDPEWREAKRRNDADTPGPYKPAKRAHMLGVLLKAQKEIQQQEPELSLINYQELVAIQVTWHRDAIFDHNVADIYNNVYGTNLRGIDFTDKEIFEKELLKESCTNHGDFELINQLLEIQKSRFLMVNKNGIQSDMENHLERHLQKKG